MATGLIGTSSFVHSLLNTNGTETTGTTLSYTCPASGVRYAVLTIQASVGMEINDAFRTGYVRAGELVAEATSDNTSAWIKDFSSQSSTYQVILGPGQSWSGSTGASCVYASGSVYASAKLIASVLEVV